MIKFNVEFRHNLICASLLEKKVGSFNANNNVVLYYIYIYIYYSSSDIDPINVVKGYHSMYIRYSETYALVCLISNKSNGKRSIAKVTSRNRRKSVRKQPDINHESASLCIAFSIQANKTKETI